MLPEKKSTAEKTFTNPILIYGMPKVGKSSAFTKLENNLFLDFEDSTKRLECYKVKIESLKHYYEVIEELKKDNKFEYVTVDTITSMEDLAKEFAEFRYSKTTFGSTWYKEQKNKYLDITNLPMGLGHTFLKDAYIDMIKALIKTNKRIIIIGHVKDSFKDESGISIQYTDLDLHNATKRALLRKIVEGIGFVYRHTENTNRITFMPLNNLVAGGNGELGNYQDTFSVFENNELKVNFDFLKF